MRSAREPTPPGYLLVRRLGEHTWEARHTASGRPVVWRAFPAAADPGTRQAVERERVVMTALSALPEVVTVLDAGTDDGLRWVALDHYPAGSFADRVAATGPLTPATALRVLQRCATALAAAHEHGILHGGVRPSAVLVDASGEAALGGFALARASVFPEPGPHVPPELLDRSGAASTASDVHALGTTVWALLAGRPPVAGEPLPDPRPDTPPELAELLRAMTVTDPAARIPDMGQVLARAADVVDRGVPTASAPEPAAPSSGVGADPPTEPFPPVPPARPPRRPAGQADTPRPPGRGHVLPAFSAVAAAILVSACIVGFEALPASAPSTPDAASSATATGASRGATAPGGAGTSTETPAPFGVPAEGHTPSADPPPPAEPTPPADPIPPADPNPPADPIPPIGPPLRADPLPSAVAEPSIGPEPSADPAPSPGPVPSADPVPSAGPAPSARPTPSLGSTPPIGPTPPTGQAPSIRESGPTPPLGQAPSAHGSGPTPPIGEAPSAHASSPGAPARPAPPAPVAERATAAPEGRATPANHPDQKPPPPEPEPPGPAPARTAPPAPTPGSPDVGHRRLVEDGAPPAPGPPPLDPAGRTLAARVLPGSVDASTCVPYPQVTGPGMVTAIRCHAVEPAGLRTAFLQFADEDAMDAFLTAVARRVPRRSGECVHDGEQVDLWRRPDDVAVRGELVCDRTVVDGVPVTQLWWSVDGTGVVAVAQDPSGAVVSRYFDRHGLIVR